MVSLIPIFKLLVRFFSGRKEINPCQTMPDGNLASVGKIEMRRPQLFWNILLAWPTEDPQCPQPFQIAPLLIGKNPIQFLMINTIRIQESPNNQFRRTRDFRFIGIFSIIILGNLQEHPGFVKKKILRCLLRHPFKLCKRRN